MRLEHVAFRYRRRAPWVLKDVSLTLTPGQVTEVTGRNGAGKSTLLRLLAGLRAPCRGDITGRPARIGYAPERFPADQPFTAGDYLDHMAAVRGLPATAWRAWADRLGLGRLLQVRLPDLSKGSAQKVGLVQALTAHPGLLVLDEPFAGLDPATRSALPPLLGELARAGSTVVVSDHQRCLEHLPALHRVHVAGGTAVSVETAAPSGAMAVLEVAVAAGEAEALAAELRARGHPVHLRQPAGPRPFGSGENTG
ncbi:MULTISPECIES: ATP-binding cassette domain-containing protein [Thermomonospora]|uniref:ABC transporter related protein n=1 Tax=Thermomonospora curvata (strain ATCC 19995 / DSM 43183 / JCM 3096 / KCTC 9072 / NBRC 15933 / NCIMB 10081 / Henssen B9) TaxID=471852 RepID=D1AAZ5_THECD|nr:MULTISPECIES: ATP-binding cassette domain-containing protein [Thermomonospora]ACY98938.1 ABC transporter related protein [Thermomonospora curvata DSM 43183]PKK13135.1 MAG: ABC transporter [Thermomonospora sp. CIF 1]